MTQLNNPNRPTRAASASLEPAYDQFADIRYKLAIEQSLLRFQIRWVRANPHLFQWSPHEQAARPDPDQTPEGTYNIELDDAWYQCEGIDQRVLAGRDLRYWLLQFLANHDNTHHSVADLITAVTDAGFTIQGRSSKTISDALHTETDRGRIRRTGWGRYQLTGPLPATTSWRIRRRCEQLRRNLERCVAHAQERLTAIWEHTLKGHMIIPKPHPHRNRSIRLRVFPPRSGRKVASPTENPRNHTPHSPGSTPPSPEPVAVSPSRGAS